MIDLYLSMPQIASALGRTPQDIRAVVRVTTPSIRTINPHPTPRGKTPKMYHLDDVLTWLRTVGDVLTRSCELKMREAARPA